MYICFCLKKIIVSFVFQPRMKNQYRSVSGDRKQLSSNEREVEENRSLRQFVGLTTYTTATSQSPWTTNGRQWWHQHTESWHTLHQRIISDLWQQLHCTRICPANSYVKWYQNILQQTKTCDWFKLTKTAVLL